MLGPAYSFFFGSWGSGIHRNGGPLTGKLGGGEAPSPGKFWANTGELTGKESKKQRKNAERVRKNAKFSPAASYITTTHQFTLKYIRKISRPKGAKKIGVPQES